MLSGYAYASFEAPLEAGWPPHDGAIRRMLEPMEGTDPLEQTGHAEDAFSKAIVIQSGAHGAYYHLVRKPGAQGLPPIAVFPESRRLPEKRRGAEEERRSNFGNFQRVLVAEPHKTARQMLVQMLRGWGFEPVPAKSGTEVLEIVSEKQPPELIVLSRTLPGIDAVELCRRITSQDSDYSPYILMLTMPSDKQEIVNALESGAAAYLTTPFEAQELRARLMVANRILRRQENLISSRDRFRVLATKDTLTGIWNKRAIQQILKEELDRAAQSNRSTGVLLVDLDFFKRVNDTHGHLAGDLVLKEASSRLKKALRTYDSIGRYGGEEFLIVVPGSTGGDLCELAERLRKAIEQEPFCLGDRKIRITLSLGAAIAPPREKQSTTILGVADAALYDAKRSGRNRVCMRGSGIEPSQMVPLQQQAMPIASTGRR